MAIKINDNGTERNMTAKEETAYLAWAEIAQAEALAQANAQAAKAEARQAVLDKLGLTADEAAALLG
jgi:hypothetical protein